MRKGGSGHPCASLPGAGVPIQVWPWASYSTALCLSFSMYKMRIAYFMGLVRKSGKLTRVAVLGLGLGP